MIAVENLFCDQNMNVYVRTLSYLRHSDATLPGQLLLGLFTRVRVTEVRVEILIQYFCGLFAEISTFASERETFLI